MSEELRLRFRSWYDTIWNNLTSITRNLLRNCQRFLSLSIVIQTLYICFVRSDMVYLFNWFAQSTFGLTPIRASAWSSSEWLNFDLAYLCWFDSLSSLFLWLRFCCLVYFSSKLKIVRKFSYFYSSSSRSMRLQLNTWFWHVIYFRHRNCVGNHFIQHLLTDTTNFCKVGHNGSFSWFF